MGPSAGVIKSKGVSLSGYELRLGRLFNGKTGRSFITAFDHAVTLGVPEGGEDAFGTLGKIIEGGPDAVLVGPGMLNKAGHMFADRNAPAPLVRCDEVQFRFLGVSMAGWNAILSLSGAAAIIFLTLKGSRR